MTQVRTSKLSPELEQWEAFLQSIRDSRGNYELRIPLRLAAFLESTIEKVYGTPGISYATKKSLSEDIVDLVLVAYQGK
jgi:hypothetical protein